MAKNDINSVMVGLNTARRPYRVSVSSAPVEIQW